MKVYHRKCKLLTKPYQVSDGKWVEFQFVDVVGDVEVGVHNPGGQGVGVIQHSSDEHWRVVVAQGRRPGAGRFFASILGVLLPY